MKRWIAILALAVFAAQGTALAAERGTAEYERLKEMKKARREEKAREQANPGSKEKGFWAKEAERSGFAGTGAMFRNAVFKVVPLDQPNSRKETK